MRLNVINLFINIALNALFIPLWGAIGAAVALVITEAIGLVVTVIRLRSLTGFSLPWNFMLRLLVPLAAATAVALFIGLGDEWLVPVFAASVVTYLGVNLLLGPVRISTVREVLKPQEPAA